MQLSLIDRWFDGIMHFLSNRNSEAQSNRKAGIYVLFTCHGELTAAVLTAKVHFILWKSSFSSSIPCAVRL